MQNPIPRQQKSASYPDRAGWREPTTSRENAEAFEAGRGPAIRDQVMAFFQGGGEDTADGLAKRLGVAERAVQPRVAEFRAKGLLEPTGERRRASGGGTAHVWRLVKQHQEVSHDD